MKETHVQSFVGGRYLHFVDLVRGSGTRSGDRVNLAVGAASSSDGDENEARSQASCEVGGVNGCDRQRIGGRSRFEWLRQKALNPSDGDEISSACRTDTDSGPTAALRCGDVRSE